MQITIPLPSRWLAPNNRPGTRRGLIARAATVKRARQDAERYAKDAVANADGADRAELLAGDPIEIQIRWFAKDRRRRDRDNALATLKPTLDGIAQALEVDDSTFRPHPVTFDVDAKHPRVEIILAAASQDRLTSLLRPTGRPEGSGGG